MLISGMGEELFTLTDQSISTANTRMTQSVIHLRINTHQHLEGCFRHKHGVKQASPLRLCTEDAGKV